MRIILWNVNGKDIIFSPLVAALTFLLAHFCCYGPILLVPLGLGGINKFISNIPYFNFLISIIALITLGYNGKRIYNKERTNRILKISYWFSVLLVIYVLIKTI